MVLIVIFNQCKDVGVGRDVGGGSARADCRGNGGGKRWDVGGRAAWADRRGRGGGRGVHIAG